MNVLTRIALLVPLTLLTGCATKVAEFRHPTTGQIGRCMPPDPAAFIVGASAISSEGDRYAACKTDFERQGYVRTPAGQEAEETKKMIRDIDEARANSIRR
ncbi:MAG TPA: hypothetical protein VIG07_00845 [Methylomirabilota bacterium]|jgi:hypothetical protein